MTTGVYAGGYPSNHFAFTRSYITELSIMGDTNDVDRVGDTFTMWIDRSIGYGVTYVLQPYILPWSSNHYTVDYVVYDCWWHAFFDGVHHPQIYAVNVWWRNTPIRQTLSIVQPAAGTMEKHFAIPAAPPTYWLPPPFQ